jgi:hypothetical protein
VKTAGFLASQKERKAFIIMSWKEEEEENQDADEEEEEKEEKGE